MNKYNDDSVECKATSTKGLEIARLPHNYRADIDGLRSIAVLPVVLFHAWPDRFPGGFIGVDMFFVISGYLISRITMNQMKQRTFTYSNFYSRRIKRIFPALLLVLVFSIIMGCCVLWKRELEAMIRTLIAGLIFSANLQILNLDNDYFDPEITSNPLLHLWSLGVEEQYYIVWPFIATSIVGSSPRKAMKLFAIIGISSFCLNLFCVLTQPIQAFFFSVCRFWEMIMGCIVAYLSMGNIVNLPIFQYPTLNRRGILTLGGSPSGVLDRNWREISIMDYLGKLGMILIGCGFCFISEQNAFPGLWALLPTLGTTLVLLSDPNAPFNRYFLGDSRLVFLGKISYPLYLWHWPLLVFSRMVYRNENSTALLAQPSVIVIISFGLSICTYYFLEEKVRYKKSKWVIPVLTSLATGLVLLGMVILNNAKSYSYLSATTPYNEITTSHPDYQKEVILTENGVINSSKSPLIVTPNVERIRAAINDFIYPPPHFLPILTNSTFHTTYPGKYDKRQKNYILNEGQKEVVIVIGDSHANQIASRFDKLYEDATSQGEKFPTIVFKTIHGVPSLPCHSAFYANINLIKRVKPRALVAIMRWPRWVRGIAKNQILSATPQCCANPRCTNQGPKDADEVVRLFFQHLKEIASLNIQVFIGGVNPEGNEFSPALMTDPSGILLKNMEPMILSKFNHRYRNLISKVDSGIRSINATKIDFTENSCYQDICRVLEPYGNPIKGDSNHFRPSYARVYLQSVDVVVKHALSGNYSTRAA